MELTPQIRDVFQAAQFGNAARLQELLQSEPALANTENTMPKLKAGKQR